MSTMKYFLVWYNNLEVEPFVKAMKKMKVFWRNRKVDMLKDGMSVLGLTMKYLFANIHPNTYFSLFDEKNKDLYHLFKNNNCGGPSIIFHRYHEKGKTHIRQHEMCAKEKDMVLVLENTRKDLNNASRY